VEVADHKGGDEHHQGRRAQGEDELPPLGLAPPPLLHAREARSRVLRHPQRIGLPLVQVGQQGRREGRHGPRRHAALLLPGQGVLPGTFEVSNVLDELLAGGLLVEPRLIGHRSITFRCGNGGHTKASRPASVPAGDAGRPFGRSFGHGGGPCHPDGQKITNVPGEVPVFSKPSGGGHFGVHHWLSQVRHHWMYPPRSSESLVLDRLPWPQVRGSSVFFAFSLIPRSAWEAVRRCLPFQIISPTPPPATRRRSPRASPGRSPRCPTGW